MKNYEILFIIKPHLPEETYTDLQEEVKKIIESTEGKILHFNAIGLKELAYEIKKSNQGFYVQCQFQGTSETVEKLQSKLKVTENVIRYMIVLLENIMTKKEIESLVGTNG